MLRIGEFAGLTGLSVKALRHYDETGVLVPSEVDDRTSYRRYSEGQIRHGVTVRALRDAGVPLPAVSAALSSGEADHALAEHRISVLERRAQEDLAFDATAVMLRALAAPIEVSERIMPAQAFVGQRIAVPLVETEMLSDDDANQVFIALFEQIQRAGLGPAGSFWTALRAGENETVDLICCWPTITQAPADAFGADAVTGTLPARTELVASWRPVAGEELPDGAMHPAVVGLFDGLAVRGSMLGAVEVRQSVSGSSAAEQVVEIAVTVSR